MVATSLDSQAFQNLYGEKHPSCVSHLNELRQRGCLVLHDMDLHYFLSRKKFDVIIFNFPHAGFYPGLGESHFQVIKRQTGLYSIVLPMKLH